LAKIGRGVLETPNGDAVVIGRDHFEGTASSAHHGVRLLKTQSHRTLLIVDKY
jgi:hypothetical protein